VAILVPVVDGPAASQVDVNGVAKLAGGNFISCMLRVRMPITTR
jgi:hypothetical protein